LEQIIIKIPGKLNMVKTDGNARVLRQFVAWDAGQNSFKIARAVAGCNVRRVDWGTFVPTSIQTVG